MCVPPWGSSYHSRLRPNDGFQHVSSELRTRSACLRPKIRLLLFPNHLSKAWCVFCAARHRSARHTARRHGTRHTCRHGVLAFRLVMFRREVDLLRSLKHTPLGKEKAKGGVVKAWAESGGRWMMCDVPCRCPPLDGKMFAFSRGAVCRLLVYCVTNSLQIQEAP